MSNAGNNQHLFRIILNINNKHLGVVVLYHLKRKQSDDALAQVCREWPIYDEAVTPNSSKSTTPPEKRHAFTAFVEVCGISDDYSGPFRKGS